MTTAQDLIDAATNKTSLIIDSENVYTNAEGVVTQRWTKYKNTAPTKVESIYDAFLRLSAQNPIPPRLPVPLSANYQFDENLLCVYPIGDIHMGAYAHSEENRNEPLNMYSVSKNLIEAHTKLLMQAPKAQTAYIISLGDALHADNKKGTTTKGTQLETDGSLWESVERLQLALTRVIDMTLVQHKYVHVLFVSGNHDASLTPLVTNIFDAYYRLDPRVTVHKERSKFHYFTFGKWLFGAHHGDTAKLSDLPSIMAVDKPLEWGTTEHRKWFVGHVHHSSVKEDQTVRIETYNTTAPPSMHDTSEGYRARREAKCEVYHATSGAWWQFVQSVVH